MVTDGAVTDLAVRERIRSDDPLYWQICELVWDEAELLDQGHLLDWHGLFTEDVRYQVPVRVDVARGQDPYSPRMFHMDETYLTLLVKAQRLVATTTAWAENPPSRTRRTIDRVRVHRSDVDGELDVSSSFILIRFRYDDGTPDVVSGVRNDVFRPREDGWAIARRTVLLDQTTLGTPNLAIFL